MFALSAPPPPPQTTTPCRTTRMTPRPHTPRPPMTKTLVLSPYFLSIFFCPCHDTRNILIAYFRIIGFMQNSIISHLNITVSFYIVVCKPKQMTVKSLLNLSLFSLPQKETRMRRSPWGVRQGDRGQVRDHLCRGVQGRSTAPAPTHTHSHMSHPLKLEQ